jgi:signal transduction histidine kinase
MGLASMLALIFSIVALSAAAFNAWIFRLRRSQTAHLWLAVAAIGIAGMGAATTQLYEATDPGTARMWQQLMLACSAPLIFGFPRFATKLLRISRPGLDASTAAMSVAALVLGLWPGAFFAGQNAERHFQVPNTQYISADITPVGLVFLAAILVLFTWLIVIFAKYRDRVGDDTKVLVPMLILWFGCGVNDIAIAVRAYDGPMLTIVGYAAFLLGFTGILTRRMTASMDVLEQSAQHLQELVEKRTEELREREQQLARGEEMATIGTLAARVAHEINTPIAFVTSNFNRLEELRDERDATPEIREILEESRQGVDRIRAIVSDLLDMAESGRHVDEPVDLRNVADSALPIVSRDARNRAALVRDFEDIPCVSGDAHQLGQVVLNLVSNALQAIPEGDPDANRVVISTRFKDGSVQLMVSDTGPGIPEEIRDRIFDPFFTTKASSGTGLGLAVTHQLVSRHRGEITLESSAAGTTATVSLPATSKISPNA